MPRVLAAAVFVTLGLGVALSGRWIVGLFTDDENVLFAGAAYFQATGLVYGFMAVSAMLFAANQGWSRATTPLLANMLRLAIVLLDGWMLLQRPTEWLSGGELCSCCSLNARTGLYFPPAKSGQQSAFWLNSRAV